VAIFTHFITVHSSVCLFRVCGSKKKEEILAFVGLLQTLEVGGCYGGVGGGFCHLSFKESHEHPSRVAGRDHKVLGGFHCS